MRVTTWKMSDSSSCEDDLLPQVSVRCYGGGPYKVPVDEPPVRAKGALKRRRGEEEAISLPGPSRKDYPLRKRKPVYVLEHNLQKRKDREDAKEERAREREEKRRQKDIDSTLKAAAKEGRKENRPGERLKKMVVVVDNTLLQSAQFMAEFAPAMKELAVDYQIGANEPGVVRWKRITTERTLNEQGGVTEERFEDSEKELLVVLQAQAFVGLVHHSKQVREFFFFMINLSESRRIFLASSWACSTTEYCEFGAVCRKFRTRKSWGENQFSCGRNGGFFEVKKKKKKFH